MNKNEALSMLRELVAKYTGVDDLPESNNLLSDKSGIDEIRLLYVFDDIESSLDCSMSSLVCDLNPLDFTLSHVADKIVSMTS